MRGDTCDARISRDFSNDDCLRKDDKRPLENGIDHQRANDYIGRLTSEWLREALDDDGSVRDHLAQFDVVADEHDIHVPSCDTASGRHNQVYERDTFADQ